MIKAVGFDYGGVIAGRPGSYFDQQVSKLLDVSVDEFRKAYFSINYKINNGLLEKEEFWKELLANLGRNQKYEEFEKLRSSIHDTKSINLEIMDLVDQLRMKGLKVGLLSNNSIDARERFEKLKLTGHFDVIMVSAEVGMSKPDPQIFSLFAEKLSVKPEELVFVDDSNNSLSSAVKVGYIPIL